MDLDFLERIEKELEYKKYLVYHFEHVEEAYHRLIEPLLHKYSKEVDDAILECGQLVPLHDLSKLSAFEFDTYRVYLYPTDLEKKDEKKNKEAFDVASDHHVHVNPHHPYFWVREKETLDMPLCYIFEMLCDWAAVASWYDSSVIEYYDKKAHKEKAAFSDKTRELVDFWIDEIFRKPKIVN